MLKSFGPIFVGLWAYVLLDSHFSRRTMLMACAVAAGCATFNWTPDYVYGREAVLLSVAASAMLALRNVLVVKTTSDVKDSLWSSATRVAELNVGALVVLRCHECIPCIRRWA